MSAILEPQSAEDRREVDLAVVLIGFLLWVFDFLVVFFLPAGLKRGRLGFVAIVATLAVAGLVLIVTGFALRRRVRG